MKRIFLLPLFAALPLAALEIAPDDPRLHYSGILSKTFVEGARRNHVMKFSRLMPHIWSTTIPARASASGPTAATSA